MRLVQIRSAVRMFSGSSLNSTFHPCYFLSHVLDIELGHIAFLTYPVDIVRPINLGDLEHLGPRCRRTARTVIEGNSIPYLLVLELGVPTLVANELLLVSFRNLSVFRLE